MSFSKAVGHAWRAYRENARLLSFFSIPFLIAFPLSLLLPNFVALSGTFLRFGSIGRDVTLLDGALILGAFAAALALVSFSIAAINMVIKSQRTITKIKHVDRAKLEENTLKLFAAFLAVFVLSLAVNLVLYDVVWNGARVQPLFGSLASLVFALAMLYVPQAVVIDGLGLWSAVRINASVMARKSTETILLLVSAGVLLLAVTGVASLFEPVLGASWRYLAVAANGLFVVPFLEVLKTQVYLTKYSLL